MNFSFCFISTQKQKALDILLVILDTCETLEPLDMTDLLFFVPPNLLVARERAWYRSSAQLTRVGMQDLWKPRRDGTGFRRAKCKTKFCKGVRSNDIFDDIGMQKFVAVCNLHMDTQSAVATKSAHGGSQRLHLLRNLHRFRACSENDPRPRSHPSFRKLPNE